MEIYYLLILLFSYNTVIHSFFSDFFTTEKKTKQEEINKNEEEEQKLNKLDLILKQNEIDITKESLRTLYNKLQVLKNSNSAVKKIQSTFNISYNSYEIEKYLSDCESARPSGIFTFSEPTISFEHVGGLQLTKKILRNLLNDDDKSNKNILFYGPPGEGKTFLAEAFAHEMSKKNKTLFCVIKPSDILQKWFGESEQKIAYLFQDARYYAKAGYQVVIFMDELDAIASSRSKSISNGSNNIVCQLLIELDGANTKSKGKNNNIIFMGASNAIENIDPAIIRNGRINKKIYVGEKNYHERIDIALKHAKKNKLVFENDTTLGIYALINSGKSSVDIETSIIGIKSAKTNGISNERKLNIQLSDFLPPEEIHIYSQLNNETILDLAKKIDKKNNITFQNNDNQKPEEIFDKKNKANSAFIKDLITK